jgi:hypothetical protein
MSKSIVMHGVVEYVEGSTENVDYGDSADAGRIKVRLDSDGDGKSTGKLVYAFPLLPKTFQTIPKVGEGVFILTSNGDPYGGQRYYIGPIISQPQFMENCPYKKGRGSAVSLLSTAKPSVVKPKTGISHSKLTKGSFPDVRDVALVGRGQEDIILKYRANNADNYCGDTSEIDLRAGIRLKASDSSVPFLEGNVVFNNSSPGYIQVKYASKGLGGLSTVPNDSIPSKYESVKKREANSLVNIVADKINLISFQDVNQSRENLTNNETLITEKKIDEIMSNLHMAVYGDELVTLLKLIVKALKEHVHHFSTLPPDPVALANLTDDKFEAILSPNVRIS